MKIWAAAILLCGMTRFAWAEEALPEAGTVLKRVHARLAALCAEAPTNAFAYARTNVVEEVDAKGKAKKRTEKVYEVALMQGLPRAKLVAIDGRELPLEEQRWRGSEERRLQRTLTQDRAVDPSKPRPWLNEDILGRFEFKVVGRTNVVGRGTLALTFKARADAPVLNMADRVVNKVAGTVWVDEEEAEISRLHIRMSEPVKFWGGILGQLDKFDYVLNRARSPLGPWFNGSSTALVQIRKLLSTTRYRVTEETGGFSRASTS